MDQLGVVLSKRKNEKCTEFSWSKVQNSRLLSILIFVHQAIISYTFCSGKICLGNSLIKIYGDIFIHLSEQ